MFSLIQMAGSGLKKMWKNYNAEWEIIEISHKLSAVKKVASVYPEP